MRKESDHITISNIGLKKGAPCITKDIFERADEMIAEFELDHKKALHARLIFEETAGMLSNIAGEFTADVWFEENNHNFSLKLKAKTRMDLDKKNDLLSVASDKKNTKVKGFMDKIGDIIQNGILNYDYVMNLSQEYAGVPVNYGALGIYGSSDALLQSGVMWSLSSYKDSLSEEMEAEGGVKEAWDELERSIVASIAKDVLVGVKGNTFEMTILCDK
ncbi:hypothetical protein SAMN06296386_10463 [Lachnospiraceae bacterium]|nr:hypothetical protein SAMN06296386_10463 [Lachnospiraceae bacterium]